MILRCVFNKVFLVNHCRDITNGYVLITLKVHRPKTMTFVSFSGSYSTNASHKVGYELSYEGSQM